MHLDKYIDCKIGKWSQDCHMCGLHIAAYFDENICKVDQICKMSIVGCIFVRESLYYILDKYQ